MGIQVFKFVVPLFFGIGLASSASAGEVVNIKSGISLGWSGTSGQDFVEEYFYHDMQIVDRRVVYIKAATEITMTHNAMNRAGDIRDGVGYPGVTDQGTIRYRLDGDLVINRVWNDQTSPNLWLTAFALSTKEVVRRFLKL